MKTRKAKKNQI
uniref:Uncharacterized protein n=1 Tax=Romanomermis culicivorax TaxID=13658 RepID=A0A915KEK7_ROMCU